jgi:hypothetical protein
VQGPQRAYALHVLLDKGPAVLALVSAIRLRIGHLPAKYFAAASARASLMIEMLRD